MESISGASAWMEQVPGGSVLTWLTLLLPGAGLAVPGDK